MNEHNAGWEKKEPAVEQSGTGTGPIVLAAVIGLVVILGWVLCGSVILWI